MKAVVTANRNCGTGKTYKYETVMLALHEASHAVIAYLLGAGITCVTIIADGNTAGSVKYLSLDMTPEEKAKVVLAGAASVMIYRFGMGEVPESGIDDFYDGSSSDWLDFEQLIGAMGGDREKISTRLQKETMKKIIKNLPAIVGVSRALLESKTLDSFELDKIVNLSRKNIPFNANKGGGQKAKK